MRIRPAREGDAWGSHTYIQKAGKQRTAELCQIMFWIFDYRISISAVGTAITR